jgi:regulator of replication initiation timing
MKKLVFISFAVFGLAGLPDKVWSMPPNSIDEQRASQSNPSSVPVTQGEFRENIRRDEGHKDDIRNLMEMFNNQFANMNSQISVLTQQVQGLNDRVLSLTNENETLKSEKDSLQQQITNMCNSIEQRKLDEAKRANDLAEKQLAQQKAEAAAIAKRESEKVARNRQRTEQLKQLEKDKNMWTGYLDDAKFPGKWNSTCGKWWNQTEVERYYENRQKAPAKIKEIEQRMVNIRASFE